MCSAGMRHWGPIVRRRGFRLVALQEPWVARRLGARNADELLREMRVLRADGQVLGGADAFVYLARFVWWAWPLALLARVRGAMPVLRAIYRVIARNRYAISRSCGLETAHRHRQGVGAYLPALLLPPIAAIATWHADPWVLMAAMALAIYFAAKWLTWCQGRDRSRPLNRRDLGYLLAWPGMDAATFLDSSFRPAPLRLRTWAWVAAKIALGALLIWIVAPRMGADHPFLVGWVGFLGLLMLVHFGVFHLLTLCWQSAGVPAAPIMRAPLAAVSVSAFWGGRWNLAFRDLSHRCIFRPCRKALGPAGGMVAAFAVSGLIHELVISLPARSGFGLPTAYFVFQGLAVLAERSPIGIRLGLRRALRGRLFALFVVIAPAITLFHPPFMGRVVVPLLGAIGAS